MLPLKINYQHDHVEMARKHPSNFLKSAIMKLFSTHVPLVHVIAINKSEKTQYKDTIKTYWKNQHLAFVLSLHLDRIQYVKM